MMDKEKLLYFKAKLIGIRSELLEQQAHLTQGFVMNETTGDDGDIAQQMIDDSLKLKMLDRIRDRIKQVDIALEKIEHNHYGICDVTGEDIETERLELQPWIPYSLAGAEELESERKRDMARFGS